MNKIFTVLWIAGMTYGAYALGGAFDVDTLGKIFMSIVGFILSIIIRFGIFGSGEGIGDSIGGFFDSDSGSSSGSGGGCSGGGSCGGGGD